MSSIEKGKDAMSSLQHAALRVAELHKGDADLVREGAKHHGVQVVERTIFEPVSRGIDNRGDYNPHLPTGFAEEAAKIKRAKKILKGCIDYRQSADIVDDPEVGVTEGEDVIWLDAGGPAQPNEERFQADVEFSAVMLKENPDAGDARFS